MAEFVPAPAANLYSLPTNFSFIQAACRAVGQHDCLADADHQSCSSRRGPRARRGGGRWRRHRDDRIAKLAGATVYASTGGPNKVRKALEIGVDQAIDYRSTDVVAAIIDITGGDGVEVVVDMWAPPPGRRACAVWERVAAWSPAGRAPPLSRRWTSASCARKQSACTARQWRTIRSSEPSWACWLPTNCIPWWTVCSHSARPGCRSLSGDSASQFGKVVLEV